jgi:hypothetical protein
MKDAEDEAFDDLAKRQGDCGSGFKAKQAMAADKVQDETDMLTIAYLDGYERGKKEALAQPEQELVAHSVIAGALFDFMGWLTSRKERIVLSSADNAAPAADAIRDFAKMRDLSLYNAQVETWREALAQPTQKPVAWMSEENNCIFFDADKPNPMDYDFWTPLYTTPPKREWVGLTDEEQQQAYEQWQNDGWGVFYNAIEAKFKEKNK